MSDPKLLKNRYHQAYFEQLCSDFESVYPHFPKGLFLEKTIASDAWEGLSLKERMQLITVTLYEVLQLSFEAVIPIFKQVIAQRKGLELEDLFFNDYVATHGLNHWGISMDALAFFTPRSTAEFAIRPFIVQAEKRTMQQMLDWSKNENHHIRRLASEGCRPRLPWGLALKSFKKDPTLILPILENLKADESEYVRRSVANNLNDISKDHPDLVLDIGQRWQGKSKGTDWVIKHALRTLLKQGNTKALLLFGYADPTAVEIEGLAVEKEEIKIGEDQFFNFSIKNKSEQALNIRLEYGIDYVKKNGSTSRKVFKITEGKYESGSHFYRRKQRFQDFSTRKHYPGKHEISLIVNGVVKATIPFELKPAL